MNILFKVNQRSALLRGINAPHSTMRIEIDPSLLNETQREILSASIAGDLASNIVIISPDYVGVLEAIAEEAAGEALAKDAEAQLVARCESALAAHKGGEPFEIIETCYSDPRTRVQNHPVILAYKVAREAHRAACDAEARGSREAKEAEERAVNKQRKLAAEAAEAAYLAAKLEVLRIAGEHELIARHHARLAPEGEFESTVKKHILAPLGLEPGHVDWACLDGRRALNATLSASEFARYQEVTKAIPDAVTEILSLQVWRDAEDDEEGDEDGEVLVPAGKWLRFTWTDAATGLEIDRAYRLDTPPVLRSSRRITESSGSGGGYQ